MYSFLVAEMVASWEWIVGQSAADKVLLVSRYEDVAEEERRRTMRGGRGEHQEG